MNQTKPIQVLGEIANQMTNLISRGIDHSHVCLFEGQIALRPWNHTKKTHIVLATLDREELQNGLTPKEWRNLQTKISHILKGTDKCQRPQKASPSQKPTLY